MDGPLLGALFALSLIPPLLFALWLRAREHHDREPVRSVVGAFVWGGTIGVAVAIFLHLIFAFGYGASGDPLRVNDAFLAAVVIAPFAEELAKGLGLRPVRRQMTELEDGIIYGAALGLGFAATENLVYGIAGLLDGGFGVAFGTVVMRTFSSMLLHAAASGIVGYGFSRVLVGRAKGATLVGSYFLAVALHASYNFLVGMGVLLGLAGAIVMVAVVMGVLRRRIETLDQPNW